MTPTATATTTSDWGLPLPAPSDAVAKLITDAHVIVWQQDDARYSLAASLLQRAMAQSPEQHPVRIICLQRLAKIARMEFQYGRAINRLTQALKLALAVLPVGHPRTLRLLEKMVQAADVQRCWGLGELIPAYRREPLRPMAEVVYAGMIRSAEEDQLPGLAALLRGDMFYSIKHHRDAYGAYSEAGRLLPADDLNRPRLRVRLRDSANFD